MMLHPALARLGRRAGLSALLLCGVIDARAGVADDRFNPRALISLPKLSELWASGAPVLSAPMFELPDFGVLLGIRDATGKRNPDIGSHGDALLAPELQDAFTDFVHAFGAERARRAGALDRLVSVRAAMRAGRHADAIADLLAIEAEWPGLHETAVCLSQACEFAGRLDEAIMWLARALERRPRTAPASEWLQVAILRAKLKLQDSPDWLSDHGVLEDVSDRAPEEIIKAIEQQLEDRQGFVTSPDAVMCDLFFQAAIRLAGADARTKRLFYFRESLRFGGWRKAEIAAWSRS